MNTNSERDSKRNRVRESAHWARECLLQGGRGRKGCQSSGGVWQLTLSMPTHGNAHTGTHSHIYGHTESNCCSCSFFGSSLQVYLPSIYVCVSLCFYCVPVCVTNFLCSHAHTHLHTLTRTAASAVNRKCLLLYYVCYSFGMCVCMFMCVCTSVCVP